MIKNENHRQILSLLVRVYNHSIQSYFYFPDVIIYGSHRLEKDEFEILVSGNYLEPYYADSFGKLYRLSKKAEDFLYQFSHLRKRKIIARSANTSFQSRLQFIVES